MRDEPLSIPPVTGERDLDFILMNARDVSALVKLWDRASSEVPRWVDGLSRSVLTNECSEMMTELGLEIRTIENGELCWISKETPKGAERRVPSFWLYVPDNIDWLARSHDETVHLYLWQYDGPERDRWVEYVQRNRGTLVRAGIRVLAFPELDAKYKGRTLLSRDLDDLFQPASLQAGTLRTRLAGEIERFTRAAVSLLRGPGAPRRAVKTRR